MPYIRSGNLNHRVAERNASNVAQSRVHINAGLIAALIKRQAVAGTGCDAALVEKRLASVGNVGRLTKTVPRQPDMRWVRRPRFHHPGSVLPFGADRVYHHDVAVVEVDVPRNDHLSGSRR